MKLLCYYIVLLMSFIYYKITWANYWIGIWAMLLINSNTQRYFKHCDYDQLSIINCCIYVVSYVKILLLMFYMLFLCHNFNRILFNIFWLIFLFWKQIEGAVNSQNIWFVIYSKPKQYKINMLFNLFAMRQTLWF